MPFLDYSYISCGVVELNDLYENPSNLVKFVYKKRWLLTDPEDAPDGFVSVLFSDIDSRGGGGNELAAYIKKNDLGDLVVETRYTLNNIKVWTWTPNWDNIKKVLS